MFSRLFVCFAKASYYRLQVNKKKKASRHVTKKKKTTKDDDDERRRRRRRRRKQKKKMYQSLCPCACSILAVRVS